MGTIKYNRSNLFQFIQTTFRKNKTNFKYFDLFSKDKILVEVNVYEGYTSAYLIKSSYSFKTNVYDSLLLNMKIRDIKGISQFCDNVEFILNGKNINKTGTIDYLEDFDNGIGGVNFNFDDIN